MNKEHIIEEIRRTAKTNGGVALGYKRFEGETGIKYLEWFGKYWTRWGDAVREAGFEPNRMNEAYSEEFLLEKLVLLTRSIGRIPVVGDIMLAAKGDPTFPSKNVFRRLGPKHKWASRIVTFCEVKPGNDDVSSIWKQAAHTPKSLEIEESDFTDSVIGYVYLLKHGTRREYKIGRTNNPMRREGEIALQLPEKLQPVHYIKTDDPAGIENYWHLRFANKRKEGEWFALTNQDIRAFKRWKKIF